MYHLHRSPVLVSSEWTVTVWTLTHLLNHFRAWVCCSLHGTDPILAVSRTGQLSSWFFFGLKAMVVLVPVVERWVFRDSTAVFPPVTDHLELDAIGHEVFRFLSPTCTKSWKWSLGNGTFTKADILLNLDSMLTRSEICDPFWCNICKQPDMSSTSMMQPNIHFLWSSIVCLYLLMNDWRIRPFRTVSWDFYVESWYSRAYDSPFWTVPFWTGRNMFSGTNLMTFLNVVVSVVCHVCVRGQAENLFTKFVVDSCIQSEQTGIR